MKILLNIFCQLYLTLWNFVRKSVCTPCLTFINYSTLQKDKNIVRRHSHIAQVQTDRVTHIYNIYIYMYTFILFSIINNNVALFTSKSKEEEEVYIFYKTGEENNIFKCWKKLGKLSSSIYMSRAPRWSGQTFWYLYEFVLRANMYNLSYMEGFTWAFHAGLYACLHRTIT